MSAPAAPPHTTFLSKFHVKDLVHAQQDVIHATESTTVEEAMNLLKKHNILSLPIFDTSKQAFVGVINLFDLVTAVAFQNVFDLYDDHKLDELTEEVFSKCTKLEIFQTPIISLLGVSEESATVWSYNEDENLNDVLDVFSKGVHRVLVRFHGKNQLTPSTSGSVALSSAPASADEKQATFARVLSQTDALRFLHFNANNASLTGIMNKTINDVGLVRPSLDSKSTSVHRVVTLASTSTALTGFQKLALNDVSGLAVVDADGKLVANLSTSDMRGMTKSDFPQVLQPVLGFLKQVHNNDEVRAPVSCTAADKLVDVINDMLQNKVHRVWVVNDSAKPIDVITCTDIIKLFIPHSH